MSAVLRGGFSRGTVELCYATVSAAGGWYVGGLLGESKTSTVTSCYATGTVTGDGDVGGLVGRVEASTIASCYATGAVTGDEYAGGLVGYNYGGTFTSCYWNQDTSGQETSPGSSGGRTTAAMTYPYASDTYVGWNFTTVWAEDVASTVNNGYPYLRGNTPIMPHPADLNKDFFIGLSEKPSPTLRAGSREAIP